MYTTDTPVIEFWKQSYRPLKLGGRSPRTIEDHLSQLSNFDRITRELRKQKGLEDREPRLGDLTDELLAEAMAYRIQEGKSKATANGLHCVVVAIWNFAFRRKVLATVPCVEKFPVPNRVRAVPTVDHFERIVTACSEANYTITYKRNRIPAKLFFPALVVMDVNIGVRINALMSIRKEDCELDQGRVLVRGENQKHRADEWFDLLPRTVEMLRPLWAFNTDLLFPWPYDKRAYTWQTLRRHLNRILEAAGLPATSEHKFHCFRRYCATRITRAKSMEEARQYLGQSSLKITRGYVDPIQGRATKRAENAFPELMGTRPEDPWVPPTPDPSGRPNLRLYAGDEVVAG